MLPKRFLTLILFAALVAMHASVLRAQWVQTNGLYGGESVLNFASIGTMLFAYTEEGMYRSSDSGNHWVLCNSAAANFYVVDEATPFVSSGSILLIGTGGGIYRSIDSGTTWSFTGLDDADINLLATDSAKIFAGSEFGSEVYYSSDRGVTWANESSGDLTGLLSLAVHDDEVFAFVQDKGLYVSSDNGSGWRILDSSYWANGLFIQSFAFEGTDIFANASWGIILSTDSGRNWTVASNGLPTFSYSPSLYIKDTNLFVCGLPQSGVGQNDAGVYATTDKGTSWNAVTGFPPQYETDIDVMGTMNNNLFAAGYFDGGIFRSTDDGASWSSVDTGFLYTSASMLYANDTTVFAGDELEVFRTTNNGDNWDEIAGSTDSTFVDAFDVQGSQVVVGIEGSDKSIALLLRSTDNGKSWITINPDLNSDIPKCGNFEISDFAWSGSILFAATHYNGVIRSTDSGASWTWAGNGLPFDQTYGYYPDVGLNVLGGIMFAICNDGGIMRSTDSGASWTSVGNLPDSSFARVLIEIGTNIFAGSTDGIFLSKDSGISWNERSEGLPDSSDVTNFATIDSNIFASIYTISKSGVYLSTDNGAHWSAVDSGLPNREHVGSLAASRSQLFTVTGGAGIWRRPLSDFGISSVAQEPAPIPLAIHTYPNPFSQSTTISFTTDAACYADVSVVNLLGAQVAHLFSGELAAGNHSFTWDASKIAAPRGMYECLVRMNGQVQSVGIIVQR